MKIHVAKRGEPAQTFELAELNQRIAAGEYEATDQAWHEGLPGWVPLSSIRGVDSRAFSAGASGSSGGPAVRREPAPAAPASGGQFWASNEAPAQDKAIWRPRSIMWASLLFTPFWGTWLVAGNAVRLGRPGAARVQYAWAVGWLLLLLALPFHRSTVLGPIWLTFLPIPWVLWIWFGPEEQSRATSQNWSDAVAIRPLGRTVVWGALFLAVYAAYFVGMLQLQKKELVSGM